ncbi:MAG: DUF3857 domain-containing protein [Crocinitomicaceae bacterium]|nr:DUF3857 domain-containing protein [Crocinitomicaceae bacterium]
MFRIQLLLFLLTVSTITWSKIPDTVFWRSHPTFIDQIDEEYQHQDAIILEDNRFINFEPDEFKVYDYVKITRHKIVHINSQGSLNQFNKVVVPIGSKGKLIEINARSILPNGTVKEINEDNIKTKHNYSDNDVTLVAIEGATVGCQIEFSYTISYPLFSMGIERYENEYPTKKAYFLLNYKSNKKVPYAYNANFQSTYFSYGTSLVCENMTPIKDELYSTYRANQPFIEYRSPVLTNFGEFKDSYFNYKRYSMKKHFQFKAVHQITVNNELNKNNLVSDTKLATVQNINKHIKKNYYLTSYSLMGHDLTHILYDNKADGLGMTMLFGAFFKEADIDYQVLRTCSKYDRWFDTTRYSPYALQQYLIYIPELNTYIAPNRQLAQVGLIPYELIGNNAVVLYDSNKRNETKASFKVIPSKSHTANVNSMNINVSPNISEKESIFDIEGFCTGQYAYSYNSDLYYSETAEEKQEELHNIILWRYPDAEIKEMKMVNEHEWGDLSYCQDYECKRAYNATVVSNTFMEFAADKVILKVGSLIGSQDAFYDNTRIQDIVQSYNKTYIYNIKIQFPEGYTYLGQENLNFNKQFKEEDGENILAQFVSEATIHDNYAVVTIKEFYAKTLIDRSFFKEFKSVINAAADFNLGIIILKKT